MHDDLADGNVGASLTTLRRAASAWAAKRAELQSSELCLDRQPLPDGQTEDNHQVHCLYFHSFKLYPKHHVNVLSTSWLQQARAGNPRAIGSAGWVGSGPQA